MDAEGLLARLKRTANGCMEWQGSRNYKGYGMLSSEGVAWRAHRIAYTLLRGPITDGLWVLHRCDNPPCCNPEHLYLGTASDNLRDRWRNRNHAPYTTKWQRPIHSKLTAAQVSQMREEHRNGRSGRALSKAFGISASQAHRILRGEDWRHLD